MSERESSGADEHDEGRHTADHDQRNGKNLALHAPQIPPEFSVESLHPSHHPSALPIIPSPPVGERKSEQGPFYLSRLLSPAGMGSKRRKISLSIRDDFPQKLKNYCLTTRYGYYSNVSRGKRQQEGLDDAIPCILEPQGNEKAFRKVGPGRFRRYTKQIPGLPEMSGVHADHRPKGELIFKGLRQPLHSTLLNRIASPCLSMQISLDKQNSPLYSRQ